MLFSKNDRQPLTVAMARARAVLAAFDDELNRAVPRLTLPAREAGALPTAAQARAAAAVHAVADSLAAMETVLGESRAMARDWHRRAELARAEGRQDLAAQARRRARETEEAAALYEDEIVEARALVGEWAAHVVSGSTAQDIRDGATN